MIIKVDQLSKEYKVKIKRNVIKDLFSGQYRQVSAVDNVSFSISKGESVALLGPNGAGKTTTMKMLTGLIYPTHGVVEVLGFTPFERKKEFLTRIGLVMGNKTGLDWDLTPRQSFQLLKRIYHLTDQQFKERLDELLTLLNLESLLDVQVRKLSLGERMKMEIVGAILHNPDILFLDEPTIGLDILSKQKIREFLRIVQTQMEVTLLLTSHDMDDIEKVCDRVIVINNGTKVYDDSLDNLMGKHKKDRYVKFIFKEMPAIVEIKKLGKIIESGENFITIKVDNKKMAELLSKVTTQYAVDDIDIISIPLEEIIAEIYKK